MKKGFEYRAFMIDSARHMQTPDEIKTVIDAMASLKFNIFHWHLTEDQGWRFECDAFPLLNTKAAVRPFSNFGKTVDKTPYGRVYTKDEMKDIVHYCAVRGIEVVPEFDMPGHMSALLHAYPAFSCSEKAVNIKTRQGIYKDVLCLAKDSVYEMVYRILDEMMDIFPGKYIHLGGDEVPHEQWQGCDKCKIRMAQNGIKSFEEYQVYFMNTVIDYLAKKGKTAIVWNDAAKSGTLDKRAVLQYWNGNTQPTAKFANEGGKVILSPFTYYYFDYDYNITPLNRVYAFQPTLKGMNDVGRKNVLGLEAPIWTEYIDDRETMQKLLFPRIIAVAALANGDEKKSYGDFVKDVKAIQPKLEAKGIAFEKESKWKRPRIASAYGWLRFTREHYTKEYIKAAKNHE